MEQKANDPKVSLIGNASTLLEQTLLLRDTLQDCANLLGSPVISSEKKANGTVPPGLGVQLEAIGNILFEINALARNIREHIASP